MDINEKRALIICSSILGVIAVRIFLRFLSNRQKRNLNKKRILKAQNRRKCQLEKLRNELNQHSNNKFMEIIQLSVPDLVEKLKIGVYSPNEVLNAYQVG